MPTRERNPWELAQSNLQQVLDEHSYKNWFSQTRFESYENGSLVVGVPSQFFADWLRDHYIDAITEAVRQVIPDFEDVCFSPTVRSVAPSQADVPVRSGKAARKGAQGAPKRKKAAATGGRSGFTHRYTFGRFVVGSGNRFAHAAAMAVAESPARAYNPLFITGGTGLGKTHLMQAIGQAIIERQPNANITYVPSEHFTNQLIASIATKSSQRFRARYRKADVLLIDDIHFIAGKDATQEEFFHTFNSLFEGHKQLVFSSDRAPKEIPGLEERLVSRFGWGLVTDIQAPDLETRVAILQSKALEEGVTVASDILDHIATHVATNIRELEGALITVLAFCRLTERKLSMTMVDEVLSDLIGREKIKPVTIEAVQRAVADHFDVRIADLCGRNRQRMVALPRQIAMFLCKNMIPSLSLSEVGEAFGGKHHTTVLHACQNIARDCEKNSATRQVLGLLEKTLRS
ncbi:MAG: chromosomal replication initiator protein DnaA [Nitrospiraceae bacterium]|nr:chromosomal replication initiator protein DnaA [Nitrospiraceae bacterium]